MNRAIKAMRYAGLTLQDFRNLSDKQDRRLLWMMIVGTVVWPYPED